VSRERWCFYNQHNSVNGKYCLSVKGTLSNVNYFSRIKIDRKKTINAQVSEFQTQTQYQLKGCTPLIKQKQNNYIQLF